MRRAARPWPAIALVIACLSLGLSALPGPPGPPAYPTRAVPTVEPLPPLSIELWFSDRSNWGGGGEAVLQAEIVAGEDVDDLVLSLALPDGLTLHGAAAPTARLGRLKREERRMQRLPVTAARDGEFPVRLDAEVRLADGRIFRIGQGATLRLGQARQEGRHRNGAYEVQGTPLSELSR